MRKQMTWSQIAEYLTRNTQRPIVTVKKCDIEHPVAAGLRNSVGLPVGQCTDWRFPASQRHGLHVREFRDYYTAHIDKVNPNHDPAGHLVRDVPAISGGVALGALVGLIVGESRGAMLLGALVGGALGASAASAQERALTNGGKSQFGGVLTTPNKPRQR